MTYKLGNMCVLDGKTKSSCSALKLIWVAVSTYGSALGLQLFQFMEGKMATKPS